MKTSNNKNGEQTRSNPFAENPNASLAHDRNNGEHPDFLASLIKRHARHWVLPGIGEAGVRALRGASVLVAGAGGLASPLLAYLAGAGVGRIRIIDPDVVSASNLERQTLYSEKDLGASKAKAAASRLLSLHSQLRIEGIVTSLCQENVASYLQDSTLVVDALDTITSKLMLHDAALITHTPIVYGSALAHVGQVASILPGYSACLRCFFGDIKSPHTPDACAERGVFAPLCGIIGAFMASETLKIIISHSSRNASPVASPVASPRSIHSPGEGSLAPLINVLLTIDPFTNHIHHLKVKRHCKWCADISSPHSPSS